MSIDAFNVKIRQIEVFDFPVVTKLLQDISSFWPDEKDLERIYKSFSSQSNTIGLVLVTIGDDGREIVIGYGSICVEVKVRGGLIAHIEDIIVHKDYRGAHLGDHLMRELITKAQECGCYKLSLECRESNVGFYEKLGFKQTGLAMTRHLQPLAEIP